MEYTDILYDVKDRVAHHDQQTPVGRVCAHRDGDHAFQQAGCDRESGDRADRRRRRVLHRRRSGRSDGVYAGGRGAVGMVGEMPRSATRPSP
jgi:hypothetical protein